MSQPRQASPTSVSFHLKIDLAYAVGTLNLAVEFHLQQRWTALFAPSGEGKTTILRLIAGLERPDTGLISFVAAGDPSREVVLCDRAQRIFVPAYRRGVSLVSQSPSLFPHLSVLRNVTYSSRRGNISKQDLDQLLALCRIEHLLHKMPAQLSGGEAQRVALARSLAVPSEQRLLLLDEPFSGLELELRAALIADLRAWTFERRIPVLMVTHDVGEIFWAGAEVIRLRGGQVVAQGTAAEVLKAERDSLLSLLERTAPVRDEAWG